MQSQRAAIGICAAAACLPGEAKDLVPWAQEQGVAPRLVQSLLDAGCRYFHAAPMCSDVEFIESALERLEAPAGWQRGVRYLVHASTQSFSIPAPPTSILVDLSRRHGFAPTLAFSVAQLACASVISAIDAAAQCLAADPHAEYALVVTSDRVFGGARYRIQGNTSVQSDGASAVLLGRTSLRCLLGPSSFKHFTQLHDGPSTPVLALTMARLLRQHMTDLLREHENTTGLPLKAIDEIHPANADQTEWQHVIENLQLRRDQFFFDNIAARGHACCADFAVNLVDRGLAQLQAGRQLLAVGQSNIGAFSALSLLPAKGSC